MPDDSPKPSARLLQLSRLPKKVSALVKGESDRGAILVLAAYIEEILGLLISESTCSADLGEELLKFRSPAGDFSSKILLCEAFGLISRDEAVAANLVRKIRNSAAHFEAKGRGFDVAFDSDITRQQAISLLETLKLGVPNMEPKHFRGAFILAVRMLALRLSLRVGETRRRPTLKSSKEIAKELREKHKDAAWSKALNEALEEARNGKPEKLHESVQATVLIMREMCKRGYKGLPDEWGALFPEGEE